MDLIQLHANGQFLIRITGKNTFRYVLSKAPGGDLTHTGSVFIVAEQNSRC